MEESTKETKGGGSRKEKEKEERRRIIGTEILHIKGKRKISGKV